MTSTTTSTSPAPVAPRSKRPRIVAGVLLLALVVAMALSTEHRSASAPVPGEQKKFDPAAYGKENYASKVEPAIEEVPVDLATLANKDPETAGEQYGKREGTSPYAYPVSVTGTAGKPEGGLMPVTVPGFPKDTRVSVQVGPAINATTRP
jgi:predicted lipoprotein